MNSNEKSMFLLHIKFSLPGALLLIVILGAGYVSGLGALFIAYAKPRGPCFSFSPEVGNTFFILSYFELK